MADKELVAKGENWARAQRERLEQAANEKASQLRRIYNEHLEWFKTHTIESLVETRRPAKRHKTNDDTDLTPTDQVKLVQSSRHTIVDESSMEGNSMRSFSRQSLTSRSFHSPTSYRSFSLTSPTANQSSSNTGTTSRQRKSLISPTRIHHDASRASRSRSVDTNPKKQQRPSLTSSKGKHDTQRRSVSKETQVERRSSSTSNKGQHDTQRRSISKKTHVKATTNKSSSATTNESSAAVATTTTNEPAAAAANEVSGATATATNEPTLATTTNEPSSSLAATAANEPSSTTTKTTTSNKTTPKESSDADNDQTPSQQNEQTNDKTGAKDNEASHVDPDFQLSETPAWAEMPELERHLRQQCNMDGHKIFGRMTPLVTSEIFGTLRQRQARK